jgi:murein DD-endopeptidase MepM/ murein hydrolase activator NlpD
MGQTRRFVLIVAAVILVAAIGAYMRGEIRAWRYRNYTEVPIMPGSNWFDFPVGAPNAKGYYRAQKFGENLHLGEDWNGMGGGNSDLGDPVYSIADGEVTFAEDIGLGWGNVVRITHPIDRRHQVEAIYAHFDELRVRKGDWVKRGQVIGTIGDCNGTYPAHLHFETRTEVGLPLGGGYSRDTTGFCDPTEFINKHRKH